MHETKSSGPGPTRGLVLHRALRYDLLASLLLFGRERAFRERLVRLARLEPGEVVLDVGCGTGSLAIAAARSVDPDGRVFGIDPSPEMLARARKKAGRAAVAIAFELASAEALPFAAGSFDVVLSTLMLHHLPRPARSVCIAEIRRVLRPGGRVLAVDFGRGAKQAKGLIAHFHRHGGVPLDEIRTLVAGAGFEITESGAVGVRDLNYVLAVAPTRP